MMTKNLKWRLKTPPTAEAVRDLVDAGVLSKDEAREILFTTEDETVEDTTALKSEINFLRELVEKLSSKTNYYPQVWTTIDTRPFRSYPWYSMYSAAASGTTFSTATNNSVQLVNSVNTAASAGSSLAARSDGGLSLGRYNVRNK
jgi:hypothetical protein